MDVSKHSIFTVFKLEASEKAQSPTFFIFLDMFKSLFLTVVAPEKPGWYSMDSDIDEEIE